MLLHEAILNQVKNLPLALLNEELQKLQQAHPLCNHIIAML